MAQAEDILHKFQKLVYLHRVRLKPLFLDFDKLRTGKVFESQFLRIINQSGLHKYISSDELQKLAGSFRSEVHKEGSKDNPLHKTDYDAFLKHVEAGFGEKNLEKTPLKEVAHEPHHLLDRLRHQRTTKALEPAKESKIEELLQKFAVDCRIKGIQVKQAFDDAARAPKLGKIVNHVTQSQFFQGLSRMNLGISPADALLLAEKFSHHKHPDLVNYAVFSTSVHPAAGSAVPGAILPVDSSATTAAA